MEQETGRDTSESPLDTRGSPAARIETPAVTGEEGWPPPAGARSGSAVAASRARLRTLVGLLGDESPRVLAVVRDELLRSGPAARAALARAARSEDARLRCRARALLAALARRAVMRRLLAYAARGEIDLEQGLFLLARLERPDLDARPYKRALDAFAREVRARADRESDGWTRPMVLVQYLGQEIGFRGATGDDHPDNVFLHRTIETRAGIPLTLAAIYVLVARRAGLRAAALPLPGHVLLRLYGGERSMIVDPFHGGKLRTRRDCIAYLARNDLAPHPGWFRDATDAQLLQRQVLNLRAIWSERGLEGEAPALYRIALVLDRVAQARS